MNLSKIFCLCLMVLTLGHRALAMKKQDCDDQDSLEQRMNNLTFESKVT